MNKQLDMFDNYDPKYLPVVPKYAVLDFETGGVDKERNALCSVAIVRVDCDFNEVDRYYTLIIDTPDKAIDGEALRINGLTRDQIRAEGKPWHSVFDDIKRLLAGCVPAAHNAAFDYGFLKLRGHDVVNAVDTMDIAWKVWPAQKAKLAMVYNRMYGRDFEGAHNSLFDVLATIELMKGFYKKDPALLEPAPIKYDRFKR